MNTLSVAVLLLLVSSASGYETTDGNTQSVTNAAGTDRPETGGESPGSGTEIPQAGEDIPDNGSQIPQVGIRKLDVGSQIPNRTRKTSDEYGEGRKNGGGQGSGDVLHPVLIGCAIVPGTIILVVYLYLTIRKVVTRLRSGLRVKGPPRFPVDMRPSGWWLDDQEQHSSLPTSARYVRQIQDDPTVDVRAP